MPYGRDGFVLRNFALKGGGIVRMIHEIVFAQALLEGAAVAVVTGCGAGVVEKLEETLLVDCFLPEVLREDGLAAPETLDGKVDLLVGFSCGECLEFLPPGRI